MNILVIGSGGREHAIIKAFSKSQSCQKIYCAPGNAGIADDAIVLNLNTKDFSAVASACIENQIDLVFIGPEDPLVDGLSDFLRDKNINVCGPSKAAALLEGSKIFAKNFMLKAEVPTAKAEVVNSVEKTLAAAKNFTAPYVLKADGLAAGKGVFICRDLNELKEAATDLFEKKSLGLAGEKALLEQNLPGQEYSFLVLTDGENFEALPLAQDHKRLLNENRGPNTGGMGTVAPLKMESSLYEKIIERIVKPSVKQINRENFIYRGVLFIGLMVVDNEPYVLEYNVRLGDPETQVVLPLIENDMCKLFYDLSRGVLQKIVFKNLHSFCIVNAAEGYPNQVVKNTPIELPLSADDCYILHAGTAKNSQGQLVTAGGRVLNIVAVAASAAEAKSKAYALNSKVKMQGRQFRTDIGQYS